MFEHGNLCMHEPLLLAHDFAIGIEQAQRDRLARLGERRSGGLLAEAGCTDAGGDAAAGPQRLLHGEQARRRT